MSEITTATELDLPASQMQGLHHVSFRVDNLDASLDFYCRIVGCRQLPRPDMGFRGAWLDSGTVQVHLLEVNEPGTGVPPTHPTALANHVAFGVDDVWAVRTYFEAQGVDVYVHSETLPQVWLQDPDGNVIEFIQTKR